MKQSTFLTLATIGLLVSSVTWAGPPENQDDAKTHLETSETMKQSDMSEPDTPEMASDAEGTDPAKIIGFEDAMTLCAEAVDIQACVDKKTGQLRVDPGDASADAMDPTDTPMDSDMVECDLDANSMEDCPE